MKICLKTIIIFGIYLILVSGVYSSFTSLLNYIHKTHGISHQFHAQIFFILNSICVIFFNILIPNIKNVNFKKLSILTSIAFFFSYLLTYFGFIIKNNIFFIIALILASILAGLGSSIVGLLSARYVNYACEVYQCKKQTGRYYGIFGGIMACNFFMGALVSAISLNIISQIHNLYLILSGLSIFAFIFCIFFVVDLQKYHENNSQIQNSNVTQNNQNRTSNSFFRLRQFKQLFNKKCLFSNLYYYKKLIYLIPFQISNGLLTGFIYHCSQDLVFAPDSQNKQSYLTINFIFIGLGCACGAYTCGFLSDKINYQKLFCIGTLVTFLSYFMSFVSLRQEIYIISLFTALISGFAMFYTNNMLVIICSKVQAGNLEIFSVNRQIINISFIAFNVIINIFSKGNMKEQMFYEIVFFIIFSLVCFFFIKYIKKQGQKTRKQINKNTLTELEQVDISIPSSINTNKNNQIYNDQLKNSQTKIQLQNGESLTKKQ